MRTHAATARLLAVAALGACAAPRPAPAPVRAAVAPARGPSLRHTIRVEGDTSFQALIVRVVHGSLGHDSVRAAMPTRLRERP